MPKKNSITIEDVKRLIVHPGEILVITMPSETLPDHFERVREFFVAYFGKRGISVLVIDTKMEVEVISKQE